MCVISVSVGDKTRHSHLSLGFSFSTSLFHLICLCHFQFSALKDFTVLKAEAYKQDADFFSCLCYWAANLSQKPSVYFAFGTIPVWKNVHKRAVCWLAVTGGAQGAEWRDSKGRDMEFSLDSWKMLSTIPWFCIVYLHGGFRSLHGVHHWHKCSASLSVP